MSFPECMLPICQEFIFIKMNYYSKLLITISEVLISRSSKQTKDTFDQKSEKRTISWLKKLKGFSWDAS